MVIYVQKGDGPVERGLPTDGAVPKERVQLSKDTITEEQQVSEEVRKEQIEEPEVNR